MPRSKKSNDGDADKDDLKRAVTKREKAAIEELLRNAFQEYSVKFESKKLERAETAERLVSFISEFLSAFMIVGYDMKGRPMNIIHAVNQMDADALGTALNKLLFNLNSSDD
jgi:hypothetical protein